MNRFTREIFDMRMRNLETAQLRCHGTFDRGPDKRTEGAWELKRPGTRMYSVQISVFGGHIAIAGDMAPTNGLVSRMPQGLAWFLNATSIRYGAADYLGEKFLEKRWHPGLCADTLRDRAKDDGYGWTPQQAEEILDLAQRCEALPCVGDANGPDGWRLQEEIHEAVDDGDGIPGWWYDPAEQGFLCAVQYKFRELWYSPRELGFYGGQLGRPADV